MIDLPADRRAHLDWLLDLTVLPDNGLAVDLGCGHGDDLCLLAERYPAAAARFIGVDRSDSSPGLEALHDARVTFRSAALDVALPFADASLDLMYSHNLVECLPDHARFAAEVARVLRRADRLSLPIGIGTRRCTMARSKRASGAWSSALPTGSKPG